MSLFKQDEWVPYVGPREGTGWINEDGEIDYGEEPPGSLDLSQFSDDEIDQLREAFEQDGRNLDQFLPNESASESSYTTENNVFEEMGVSIDDLQTSRFRELNPRLDRESVEELKEGFSQKHGDAWDDYHDLYRSWKGRSDDDNAVKREKTLIEVLGIENPNLRDGDSEDFDPEQYDPPEELVEVAQDVVDSTRNFLEEHYADEDGNVEVSRGTSAEVGYNVWDTVFKKFLDGETIENPDVNLKSMANYTVNDNVSEDFGKKSVQIIEEKDVEDAICAEDLILNSAGSELEVSFVGGQTDLDPEQIKIQSDWNPLDLLENADSIDDDTWDSILGTCDSSLGRNRRDVKMGRDLSLNPDVLEAQKKIANTAIENVNDEEVEQQAYEVIEESNKYLRLMDENKMSKQDSQLTIDLTGEEDNNWLSHVDDDEEEDDNEKSKGSLFRKAEWEPYEGPQGGFGWRNTDNGEVVYQPEPPGEFSTEGLSDEELGVLAQVVESQGGDPSVLDGGRDTTENIELPSIEDFDEGDEIYLQRSTSGPERYTVDRINESEVADTKLVLEDSYGDLSSVGPEDLENRALPVGDMPEYSKVPEWSDEGTPLLLAREKADGTVVDQEVKISDKSDNILSLMGDVTAPDMLIFLEDEIVSPFDTASESIAYHSPEHGELTFTGETDGYREYIFETENGENVTVNPDEEDLYEKPVSDVTVKKSPDFTDVEEAFGEENSKVIQDTIQNIINVNDTAVSEVYAQNQIQLGSKDTIASFNFKTSKIGLSQDSLNEDKLKKYAVKMEENGWLGKGSIEHVCAHEVMHSIHRHSFEGDFPKQWDDGDRELSESVSEYGSYNPSEFVAEYGALLLLGNVDTVIEDDLRENLDAMFEKYGGLSVEELNPI